MSLKVCSICNDLITLEEHIVKIPADRGLYAHQKCFLSK